MSPRLRRSLRRLRWTLVRIAARSLALGAARVIRFAVDCELAADAAQGLTAPVARQQASPLPARAVAPPVPTLRPSPREQKLAVFCGQEGVGVFVLSDQLASIVRNGGRC